MLACDVDPPTPGALGVAPEVVSTSIDVDAGASLPALALGQPITIDVSRLLAPRTIRRSTIQVASGPVEVIGGIAYDPARKRLTFVPEATTMLASIQYTLVVNTGLTAWDGTASTATTVRYFESGTATVAPVAPPTSPTLSGDVAPLLAANCALAGCHVAPNPLMALDLSSAQAIANTSVGILAREHSATGANAPEYSDPHWGTLARVDPVGGPQYSYLLYKLLGDGPFDGDRMPPPPAAQLSADQIALVSDWIARGAPSD